MKKREKLEGISISEFVGMLGTVHSCHNLKHQGLKSFQNPYVVGISNDVALKNPDFVLREEIIVVIDDYGNPGTYLNPENLKKITELEICRYQLKLLNRISIHNFNNVSILYQKSKELIERINYLETFYINTYDLLHYLGKQKVLRDIRKYAHLEAEKTFNLIMLPTINSNDKSVDDIVKIYQESNKPCNDSLINEDDNYQVTEKINRQKTLGFYKKLG